MSAHGIATPRSRSTPRSPSSVQALISESPLKRAFPKSAPLRSQPRKATDSRRAWRKSASRRSQRSNTTRSNFVPSKVARSARQSRRAASRSSPAVQAKPVRRQPSSSTRRIEPLRTTAFARLHRPRRQSARNRFWSVAALRSVASSSESVKPRARASAPASEVSTSTTSSHDSPSATSSGLSTSGSTAAVSFSRTVNYPVGQRKRALPGDIRRVHESAACLQHKPTREYTVAQVGIRELLEAGVHFGHQTRRWNPKMRRFIFGERAGIHIIDLQQTDRLLKQAQEFTADIASRGGTVMFVGT